MLDEWGVRGVWTGDMEWKQRDFDACGFRLCDVRNLEVRPSKEPKIEENKMPCNECITQPIFQYGTEGGSTSSRLGLLSFVFVLFCLSRSLMIRLRPGLICRNCMTSLPD